MVDDSSKVIARLNERPGTVVINVPASMFGYTLSIEAAQNQYAQQSPASTQPPAQSPPPTLNPVVPAAESQPPAAQAPPAQAPQQPMYTAQAPQSTVLTPDMVTQPYAPPAMQSRPTAPTLIIPAAKEGKDGKKTAPHEEYTTIFPCVAEHLEKDYPTRGVARMLLANLKLDSGVKASIDDVVRDAIFHTDIHGDDLEPMYLKPNDIPPALISTVRERVVADITENDFENNYQSIISLTSNIEKYMIELVSKGEIGLSFWTMRSAGEKGKGKSGFSPYDALINTENMAFGASSVYNLYRLGHDHDQDEGMLKVLSRVATNPYVSMQIGYLFGVGVGLPIMADAVSSGHPIEYVQEHFIKKIGEVFHMDQHSDGLLAKAQEAGHKFVTERYGGVVKQFGEAAHGMENTIKNDPDHEYSHQLGRFLQQHPMIAGAYHLMGDEITVITRTSGLGIRLIHGACMMQPVQTDLMMRACIRHNAQNHTMQMYHAGELEKYPPVKR